MVDATVTVAVCEVVTDGVELIIFLQITLLIGYPLNHAVHWGRRGIGDAKCFRQAVLLFPTGPCNICESQVQEISHDVLYISTEQTHHNKLQILVNRRHMFDIFTPRRNTEMWGSALPSPKEFWCHTQSPECQDYLRHPRRLAELFSRVSLLVSETLHLLEMLWQEKVLMILKTTCVTHLIIISEDLYIAMADIKLVIWNIVTLENCVFSNSLRLCNFGKFPTLLSQYRYRHKPIKIPYRLNTIA